jgi:hypothetical protein
VTAGLSTTRAHAIINTYRGSNYTAVSTWLKLHTGDPGSAGTANASAETTRLQITLAAPSAGSSVAPEVVWEDWDAGPEEITHASIWSDETVGAFQESFALAASKAVANSDDLGIVVTVAFTPIAA